METSSAVQWCLLLAVAYVASLYAIPSRVRSLPRSHPTHIKYRMAVVSVVTVLLGILLAAILQNATQESAWRLFGFAPDTFASSITVSMKVICTLFVGPLVVLAYETYVRTQLHAEKTQEPHWQAFVKYIQNCSHEKAVVDGWASMRNLVTGPVTEEIVFRAYMLPLLLVSGVDPTTACLASPAFFGAAHLHHAVELLKMQYPLSNVLISTFFQMAYTWVFGIIAAFMLVGTNSVAGPIAAHMFCNFMGLPDLTFLSQPSSREEALVHKGRFVFLAVYILGIIGFVYGMRELTSTLPPPNL